MQIWISPTDPLAHVCRKIIKNVKTVINQRRPFFHVGDYVRLFVMNMCMVHIWCLTHLFAHSITTGHSVHRMKPNKIWCPAASTCWRPYVKEPIYGTGKKLSWQNVINSTKVRTAQHCHICFSLGKMTRSSHENIPIGTTKHTIYYFQNKWNTHAVTHSDCR